MNRYVSALPTILVVASVLILSGCENNGATDTTTTSTTSSSEPTKVSAPSTSESNQAAAPNQLAASPASTDTPVRGQGRGERMAEQPLTGANGEKLTDVQRIRADGVKSGERFAVKEDGSLDPEATRRLRNRMTDDQLNQPTNEKPLVKTDTAQFVDVNAPTVIHAEPAMVELGEVSTSDIGMGTVKLVNKSDQPMRLIECKSSCGCTTTNCPKGQVIPANGFLELDVRLTASATPNDSLTKNLTYVVENHPVITVPVHAKVISFIGVEPQTFDTDKSVDGTLTLRAVDNEPFVVTSIIPAIIDEFSTEPAVVQELQIDWDKYVDAAHRGRITIYTSHPKCRAVYANVRGAKATLAQQKWIESRPSTRENPGLTATERAPTSDAQFQAHTVQLAPVDARLHANAKIENVEEIRKAIKDGGNINVPDANGKTPLHVAATNGKVEAIKTLYELGAKLDARDRSGRTPLMWAVESRNPKAVEVLLEKGADISSRDETGGTALMWASGFGDGSTLKAIIDAGAEIDVTDDHGMSALMWAASFGDGERVKILIDAGIDLNLVDGSRGCSAVMYAARSSGAVETLKALVDAGADISLVDVTGRTALSWAALLGTPEKVQLLLDSGSDVTKEDFRGWTALAYATNRRDRSGPQIRALLEDATAKAAAQGDDKAAAPDDAVDPQARK